MFPGPVQSRRKRKRRQYGFSFQGEPMHLMKEVVFPLAVFFAGLTLFCTKNSPTGPGSASGSGSLETAASVVVDTETIPSSGGTFAITNSSSAINGFSITVPANAFSGSRDFQVSTSEIKSHTFGADFHPVTPVVTIDAGAGYADSAIIITIPAKIPSSSFAMGFIWTISQRLSGRTAGCDRRRASITVATRTFTAPSAQPGLAEIVLPFDHRALNFGERHRHDGPLQQRDHSVRLSSAGRRSGNLSMPGPILQTAACARGRALPPCGITARRNQRPPAVALSCL